MLCDKCKKAINYCPHCGKKLAPKVKAKPPIEREKLAELLKTHFDNFFEKEQLRTALAISDDEVFSRVKIFIFAEQQSTEQFCKDLLDDLYSD